MIEWSGKISAVISRISGVLSGSYQVLNKVFFIALVVFLLGWYFFDSIAKFLVSDDDVKEMIIESLNNASGRQTMVNGDIEFDTKPEPYIVIKDVIISNDENAHSSANFAEIGEISTRPNLAALARGKVDFKELLVKDSKIFVEAQDNKDRVVYKTIASFFSDDTDYSGKKITFRNLEVNLHKKSPIENSQGYVKRRILFSELTLDPSPPEDGYTIKGAIKVDDFQEEHQFYINFEEGLGVDSKFTAKLFSNDMEIRFSGSANTNGTIEIDGKLEGTVGAFCYKLLKVLGLGDDITDSIKTNEVANISGDISISENDISLKSISAKSDIIDLKFNSETKISDRYKNLLNIEIATLDYTKLFKTRKEQISIKRAEVIEKDFNKRLQKFALFSMGDDIDFNANLNIRNINFFNGKSGNLELILSQENNLFSVDKFEVRLPGRTEFKTFAKVQINKRDLTMEGKMALALAGTDMNELATGLGIINDPKLAPNLGVFYLRTNGIFSGRKIHFKEIISEINDNRFAGQLLIEYENKFSASSAFNFDKLELDNYITKQEGKKNYQDDFSRKIDFLRFIDSIFDELKIALTVDRLTKSGEILKDFALYAQVTPSLTRIIDLYFITKRFGVLRANAVIDIDDFQPQVDVNLKMDRFDLDYLEYGKPVTKNDKFRFTGKWDRSPVSFEWLGYMQGKATIAIDKLKAYHHNLEGFRTVMDLKGSKVIINDSKFELFGNKIDYNGELTTEYPSFKIAFVSANLSIKDFLKNIFGFKQISGRFNVSGIVAATGYSLDQMVKNARGRIEVITNGFKITGFDIFGFSRNIINAERMEQAKEIGLQYLNNGETIFGPMSASFGINKGDLFFSNLEMKMVKLGTSAVSNGKIDLLNWSVNVKTDFDVTAADGIKIGLVLKTNGTVAEQDLYWNEEALIKYWEDKFYGVTTPSKGKSR